MCSGCKFYGLNDFFLVKTCREADFQKEKAPPKREMAPPPRQLPHPPDPSPRQLVPLVEANCSSYEPEKIRILTF